MYYVYVLQDNLTKALYYGYSNNVQRRLTEHNIKGNWRLVYYEAYLSESDARKRERKLKQYGQARTQLKKRISISLE